MRPLKNLMRLLTGSVAGLCLTGTINLNAQAADYYVCVGNDANGRYEVYDPTVTDWNSSSALKWSFAPTTGGGWTSAEVAAYSNPSDMKLRWRNGSQVVVSTASGGLATIASYPGGSMIWTLDIGGSYNCHSAELLPNGNIAIAASTGNFVRVYASSQSSRNSTYAAVSLTGAHAVLWDPKNNVLWALGTSALLKLSVGGSAASPTLTQVASIALPASGGHDLSPNYGDPNTLWVTTSLNAWLFYKSSQTFAGAPGSVNRTAVKGCGNQPSGEIAQCQQDNSVCTLNTWCTPNVNFFTPAGAADYTRTKTGAAFYKCRIFTPDYEPIFTPIIGGDFDGDGQPDSVLFCACTGVWGVRYSSNPSYIHEFTFGQNGDIGLMKGDFDGDGEPDAVLFRPSNGTWYVRFSTDGSIHHFALGTSGDIPMLGGDFDGDGQPDAVVFHPATATWTVRFSGDQSTHTFSFGQSTDIPMMNGDWNGDGLPDAVLFRPSTAEWYVRYSNDASVNPFSFGTTGDIPLIGGDFDGTNQAPDAVLFRPSNANWYIQDSAAGTVQSFPLGDSTIIPLMNGDYDGDGLPDAVTYRPANRTWTVRFSNGGSTHTFTYGF
jgi:hypothetical protein